MACLFILFYSAILYNTTAYLLQNILLICLSFKMSITQTPIHCLHFSGTQIQTRLGNNFHIKYQYSLVKTTNNKTWQKGQIMSGSLKQHYYHHSFQEYKIHFHVFNRFNLSIKAVWIRKEVSICIGKMPIPRQCICFRIYYYFAKQSIHWK